jgi:hypothetical protein
MGVKDLPKPGIGFRTTTGAGNFQTKLSGATRYGELKNLRDNQKAIIDVVKKYQRAIRTAGGLSRLQQRDARLKMMKIDKTITKEDRDEINKVLGYLGRGAATAQGKKAMGKKAVKTSDGRSYLTEKQIAANLRYNKSVDRSALEETVDRFNRNKTLAGVGGGVHGVASRLGVKTRQAGAGISALQNKSSDTSRSESPAKPLGGIKPII